MASHPSHYTETVTSLHGEPLLLKAAVSVEPWDKHPHVDTWGRIGNSNPIYPPRDPDKSVKKHGGVEGYKKSPARGLFHHISIGAYLAFNARALKHFLIPNKIR